MDAEIQAFIDKQAEKAAVKARVMEAVGEARLAEAQSRDATPFWKIVEEEGINGTEGILAAELQAMADEYVSTHEAEFASFELLFTGTEGQELLVNTLTLWREQGLAEQATLATMWELTRFERKNIGAKVEAKMRPLPGGKG